MVSRRKCHLFIEVAWSKPWDVKLLALSFRTATTLQKNVICSLNVRTSLDQAELSRIESHTSILILLALKMRRKMPGKPQGWLSQRPLSPASRCPWNALGPQLCPRDRATITVAQAALRLVHSPASSLEKASGSFSSSRGRLLSPTNRIRAPPLPFQ